MTEPTRLQLAFFDRLGDIVPKRRSLPWEEFVGLVHVHYVRNEKDGRLFSLTDYRDGATRGNDGVTRLTGFAGDVDDGWPLDEAESVLRRGGWAYVIYTTHSHTAEKPKFRIVVPFLAPVPVAEWERVWQQLDEVVEGHLDPGTKDPARISFLPSHPPGAPSEVRVGEGRPLDVTALPPLIDIEQVCAKLERLPLGAEAAEIARRLFDGRVTSDGWPGDANDWFVQMLVDAGLSPGEVERFHRHKETVRHTSDWADRAKRISKKGADGKPKKTFHLRRATLEKSPFFRSIAEEVRKRQPLPHRGDGDDRRAPWSGKPGWEAEPEIPILLKDEEYTDEKGETKIRKVPKERAYIQYNRLVTGSGYRPFRLSTGEPRVAIPTQWGLVVRDPAEDDSGFGNWVGYQEFTRIGEPVPRPALKIVTTAMAERATALDLPAERVVSLAVRLAARKPFGSYLDMCDQSCRTIVVGPEGWSIQQIGMPVFDRPRHLKQLPDPVAPGGGDVNLLWKYVLLLPREEKPPNGDVKSWPDQRLLALAGLVQQLVYPASAKTADIICGGDGAGKTSTMRALADVLDPSLVPTIAPPKKGEEGKLEEKARNRFTLRLDNVSRISADLSDLLCRLVTGVGFANRMLYTDRDESVSAACNKVSINGITATPTASDLLRRSAMYDVVKPGKLGLPLLGDTAVADAWERDHPSILGGVLDTAVKVMRQLRDAPPADPPDDSSNSMAEYVRVGRALSLALYGSTGRFDAAWRANTERQAEGAMQDPRMAALVDFWAERSVDSPAVTSTELARQISERAKPELKEDVSPDTAGRLMSRAIRLLETKGIHVEKHVEHNRASYQRVKEPVVKGGSSPPSPPLEGFSDEKRPGGLGGGLRVDLKTSPPGTTPEPPSSPPGTTPQVHPPFSDVEGGLGGLGGVVSENSKTQSGPPTKPNPATGEDRERLLQVLKFQLGSEKRDEKDPAVLDVKCLLWGRALHASCETCVSIEHHVCLACPACAWQENHGGEPAEAGP